MNLKVKMCIYIVCYYLQNILLYAVIYYSEPTKPNNGEKGTNGNGLE